jgi:hypothetical protein
MACNYSFEQSIEVCVDGAVGGGSTARLDVWFGDMPYTYLTYPVPARIGHVNDWDGSEVHFSNFDQGTWGGCDVTSSRVTVELVTDNTVQVTLTVKVANCSGDIYYQCGGVGPFTITDSYTLPLNLGASCSDGVSGP